MTIYSSTLAQTDVDWFATHNIQTFVIRLASEEESLHFRTKLDVHPAVRSKVYVIARRSAGSFTIMHASNLLNETQASLARFWRDLMEDEHNREQRMRARPSPSRVA
jgi:hypothetical protein